MLYQSDFNLIFGFEFLQFFAEAGFPCPSRRSPSDHFLRCINSDFDIVTATLKGSQRLRVCLIFHHIYHANFQFSLFCTRLNFQSFVHVVLYLKNSTLETKHPAF